MAAANHPFAGSSQTSLVLIISHPTSDPQAHSFTDTDSDEEHKYESEEARPGSGLQLPSPSESSHALDHAHEDEEHARERRDSTSSEPDAAQKMAKLGHFVAPPAMLPPSPPLTPLDAPRTHTRTPSLPQARPGVDPDLELGLGSRSRIGVALGEDESDPELDITNWAEDDLGSVTTQDVSPSADDAVRSAFGGGVLGPQSMRVHEQDHPLRADAPGAISPPPWERIDPPGTNNHPYGMQIIGTKPLYVLLGFNNLEHVCRNPCYVPC